MRIGSADLLDGIVGFQSQFRNGGGGEAREIPNARKKKLIQNLFIFYFTVRSRIELDARRSEKLGCGIKERMAGRRKQIGMNPDRN
jgi:hypothetical protein